MFRKILTRIFLSCLFSFQLLFSQTPFLTTWNTQEAGVSNTTSVHLNWGTSFWGAYFPCDIDWENDGIWDTLGVVGNITHDYGTAGTYQISIRADSGWFKTEDPMKLVSIDQWGDNTWLSMSTSYYGCENMVYMATDTPNLSFLQDLSYCFYRCRSFNGDISGWDVSNVKHFRYTFSGASVFNQDISSWDVSNAEDMEGTFRSALAFNQDLSSWDVSNVFNFDRIFFKARSFDQNLYNWDFSYAGRINDIVSHSDLSVAHYDSLLFGLAATYSKTMAFPFNSYEMYYCQAESARASLIQTGLTFTGDSLHCHEDAFISLWKTDNPGSTNSTSVQIPTFAGETYNYSVDWENDGIIDTAGVTGSISHDYGVAGNYTIAILGTFPRIFFNHEDDRLKILAVNQWGTTPWTSMAHAFGGCENLLILDQDVPDLSLCADMTAAFSGALSLEDGIAHWDVSAVTTMDSTLYNTQNFNESLENWSIGQVNSMQGMLSHSGIDIQNYDFTIIGWNAQGVQPNLSLGAEGLKYCMGATSHDSLTQQNGWTITGDSLACSAPFITTWRTDLPGLSGSTSIQIPTHPNLTYYYDIDWENDGIWDDVGVTGTIAHAYGVADTYQVAIQGIFPRIFFNNTGDKEKIISVDQWGSIPWFSMEKAFSGCRNLTINALDAPDLSGVSVINRMFEGTGPLATNLNHWDVSTIKNMAFMFRESKFNGDISAWDVSSVESFFSMFSKDSVFNGDLSSWDLSSAENLGFMFKDALSFGGDISAWNVSKVENMNSTFENAVSFNIDLGNWDVRFVQTFKETFYRASSFNQALGDWDLGDATNMENMLDSSGISFLNYDSTLTAWRYNYGNMPYNVKIGVAGLNYCLSSPDRQYLIINRGWIFEGDQFGCWEEFITRWQTNLLSDGNPNGIRIPTFPGETYNYDVDWDFDGVWDDFGLTGDASHTYSTAGQYSIAIRGLFPRIYLNGDSTGRELSEIYNWGNNQWSSMENAFMGAENLELNTMGSPDLNFVNSMRNMFSDCEQINADLSNWDVSNVTDMSGMFENCSDFDQSFYNWDVSNVTDMAGMFQNCSGFNQPLSNWDISNVSNMSDMLSETGLSVINYDSTLIGWAGLNLQDSVQLGADGLGFCNSDSQRSFMIDSLHWSIIGDRDSCFDELFRTSWSINTNSALTLFTVPTSANANYWVDFGNDGIVDLQNQSGDVILPAGNFGWIEVVIGGHFPVLEARSGTYLRSVDAWGNWPWEKLNNAFDNCTKLFSLPNSPPNLSLVNNLTRMFYGCLNLNSNINDWNVSNVTNMKEMFYYCRKFNSPLDDWDVSKVTDMNSLFYENYDFNQPLNNWDVSSVTDMSSLFYKNYVFNQPLNNWDVSSVTDMSSLLYDNSVFNQPLNNWDVSSVTDMSSLFYDNSDFNQPLNNWDVSNVIDMNEMFSRASSFNQPLNNWDVSNVTNMEQMFFSCHVFNQSLHNWEVSSVTNMRFMFLNATSFNQPLNNWDVSSVTTMESMFSHAEKFNQPLDNWDVSGVTNMYRIFSNTTDFNGALDTWNVSNLTTMEYMFQYALSFNQPLNNWDVSSVTKMTEMFSYANMFNQPLNNWDVSNVTDMTRMFKDAQSFNQDLGSWDLSSIYSIYNILKNSGMNTMNYDNTLIGWAAQPPINNLHFGFTQLHYCLGISARNILLGRGWYLDGDIYDCSLDFNSAIVHPDCALQGSIELTPYLGNPPYSISWTHGDTSSLITGLDSGSYSVTITDQVGDSWTQDFTLTIQEDSHLVAICPPIPAVILDSDGNGTLAPDIGQGLSSACYSIPIIESSPGALYSCNDLGIQSVMLTAQDSSGNIDSTECYFMVEDTIAPTVSCPLSSSQFYLDSSGQIFIPDSISTGWGSDNCGVFSLDYFIQGFDCTPLSINYFILSIEDASENTDTVSCQFTLLDSLAPIGVCPIISPVFLDSNGQGLLPPNVGSGLSYDNCGPVTEQSDSYTIDCASLVNPTFVLTITDLHLNTTSISCSFSVLDTIAPQVFCPPIFPVYIDSNGMGNIPDSLGLNSITDNCGISVFQVLSPDRSCSDLGLNEYILTATDISGNTDSILCQFELIDTLAPIGICPLIPSVYLDSDGHAFIPPNIGTGLSYDNCGLVTEQSDSSSLDCASLGNQSVELFVTGLNGNGGSVSCPFEVLDTLAPEAICPPLIQVYLDSAGQGNIHDSLFSGLVSDNCGLSDFGSSNTLFNCADLGMNDYTLFATDFSENTDSVLCQFELLDSLVLDFSCMPSPHPLYLSGSGSVIIPQEYTVANLWDNCGSFSMSHIPTFFDCETMNSITFHIVGSGDSGFLDSLDCTVQVLDTISPTAVCPVLPPVYLNIQGLAGLPEDIGEGLSHDNCEGLTESSIATTLSCSDIGQNTIELHSEDKYGNISSALCPFSVFDTFPPTIDCPSSMLDLYADASGSIQVNFPNPDVQDNCPTPTFQLTSGLSSGSLFSPGVYLQTYHVNDTDGNTDSCSFIIEVLADTTTGFALEESNPDIKIYPNPFQKNINIEFENSLNGELNIAVFDIYGKLIFHRKEVAIDNNITLSSLDWAKGVYILRVSTSNFSAQRKVIKE